MFPLQGSACFPDNECVCGPLFTLGRGTNFPIVFSAHKIMETKEDWARTAQETEGNFIPGSTHTQMEKEEKKE